MNVIFCVDWCVLEIASIITLSFLLMLENLRDFFGENLVVFSDSLELLNGTKLHRQYDEWVDMFKLKKSMVRILQ